MKSENILLKLNKRSGFTLIEVMITIAILGILMAIAIPSYQSQIQKGRRSDAMVSLVETMNRQDVFKANYGGYTTIITGPGDCSGAACGLNFTDANSNEGYYTLTAAAGPTGNIASSVTLTATTAGAQTSDSNCTTFTISSTGVKGATGADSDNCW